MIKKSKKKLSNESIPIELDEVNEDAICPAKSKLNNVFASGASLPGLSRVVFLVKLARVGGELAGAQHRRSVSLCNLERQLLGLFFARFVEAGNNHVLKRGPAVEVPLLLGLDLRRWKATFVLRNALMLQVVDYSFSNFCFLVRWIRFRP